MRTGRGGGGRGRRGTPPLGAAELDDVDVGDAAVGAVSSTKSSPPSPCVSPRHTSPSGSSRGAGRPPTARGRRRPRRGSASRAAPAPRSSRRARSPRRRALAPTPSRAARTPRPTAGRRRRAGPRRERDRAIRKLQHRQAWACAGKRAVNGVSRLHGKVSRGLFQPLLPLADGRSAGRTRDQRCPYAELGTRRRPTVLDEGLWRELVPLGTDGGPGARHWPHLTPGSGNFALPPARRLLNTLANDCPSNWPRQVRWPRRLRVRSICLMPTR